MFLSLKKSSVEFELVLAIEACHARGVLHNDIKPENVLVTSDGHMVLTDFGIAELLLPGEKTFGRYGTPLYMAPELFIRNHYENTSDLWSLGVILFMMITGNHLFSSKNMTGKCMVRIDYMASGATQSLVLGENYKISPTSDIINGLRKLDCVEGLELIYSSM